MKVRGAKFFWKAAVAAALVGGVGCSDPSATDDGKAPPDASLPKTQFVKAEGYEAAWGTPDPNVVLALRDLNQNAIGKLDLLVKGKDAKAVSGGTDANIKVSLTKPAAALFLESIGPNQGVLAWADLTDGEKTLVPKGTATRIDSFWFGPESNTVLFLAEPTSENVRTKMFFWDGEESKELATGVAPGSVQISKDRKYAIAGSDVAATGVGDVKRVNLATGAIEEVARDVTVLTGAASAISMDDAGEVVGFATAGGEVMRWTKGESKQLGSGGAFPGVSSDGKAVAWTSGGQVVVWKGDNAVIHVTMPKDAQGNDRNAKFARTPRFSPLNDYVAWFDKVVTTNGPVSDAYIAATFEDNVAVQLGEAVSLTTFRFSETSSRVSAVMGLKSPAGTYDGKASNGSLGLSAAGKPLATVFEKVWAAGVAPLVVSDRIAFIADIKPGSKGDLGRGRLYVTSENLDEPPLLVAERIAPNSVQTPTDGFDRLIYLTLEDEDRYTSKNQIKGTLWATRIGAAPKRLESNVMFWSITPTGRAVAVVREGPNAGVWTFPLAL